MEAEVVDKIGWSEILSALWFILVALVFFALPWGIVLPMNLLTALYGLVLLTSCATLVLSLVAQSQKGMKKRVE